MGGCQSSGGAAQPSKHQLEQKQAVTDVLQELSSGAESISCTGRSLRNQGAICVARGLARYRTVKSLKLDRNGIGEQGVKELAASLGACTMLQSLDLSFNRLGDTGVAHLAKALEQNTTLTFLSLTRNQFGDFGASCLAGMLRTNNVLKLLLLEGNGISDSGTAMLGQALTNNHSLQVLWLLDNPVGPSGLACFARAMDSNDTLAKFGFTVGPECLPQILADVEHLTESNVVRRAIRSLASGHHLLAQPEISFQEFEEQVPFGPGGIYHEKQVGSLCAVHCLNNLMQEPMFSESQLREVARQLDAEESRLAWGTGLGDSGNCGSGGFFNVQVIRAALQTAGYQMELLQASGAKEALDSPELQRGFICNRNEHWFALRRIGDEWFDLNSCLPIPKHFNDFQLNRYIHDALSNSYSVFLVHGEYPISELEKDSSRLKAAVIGCTQVDDVYLAKPDLASATDQIGSDERLTVAI